MSDPSNILPILQRRGQIEEAIRRHQVIIVCGETGSGKTTQLPQICLEMLGGAKGEPAPGGQRSPMIGHTQPRRLAARSVAARIAEERGEQLGQTVGVQVRFQDHTSRQTRIKVMTDGILLAELSSDPLLSAYSTIILDEAHERSLNIDFLLGYLRQMLPRRPDLKLVITSATIDPARFSNYFGGPTVSPVIEVSGRTFPVEVRYHPTRASEEDFDRVEFEGVADAVEELCSPRTPGDVLVFLPGERDIKLAGDAIGRRHLDVLVLPLFSRLTDQQQDLIFHPSGDRRRIILSTNVAETSLTVPGIRNVVDTGLARLSRYDSQRKIQRLPIEPISRASANQRAGRCGRVAAGVCIRLYGEETYAERPAFTEPEIRRTSLASVILRMKSLGPRLGDIDDFVFLDPPDARAIKDGYDTLFELGAVTAADRGGSLTPMGERMSRVPLDPRIARILLGAEKERTVNEAVILAAVLSIQDPRERPMARQEDADRAHAVFKHEASDFLTLLKLWDQYTHVTANNSSGALASWCRDHFLSHSRMREWGEMVRQLRDIADELCLAFNETAASADAVHRTLMTGLMSNVACREGDGSFDYRGIRDNVVQIFPGSVLFKKGPKWIMAAEIVQTTRLYARTVARIDPAWIEELAGHLFTHQYSDRHLDPTSGQPCAFERVSLSTIVVVPRREVPIAAIDPEASRVIFIRDALALMKWNTDLLFMEHNRRVMERARTAEARLRRRDVIVPESVIVEWFESRVPRGIVEPTAFAAWLSEVEGSAHHSQQQEWIGQQQWTGRPARTNATPIRPGETPGPLSVEPGVMRLLPENVIQGASLVALDPEQFPDAIEVGEGEACPLEYSLAPGKDEDGVTLTVPLIHLSSLTAERAAWLVPGMLPQVVQGLIKTLPKAARALLEKQGEVTEIGAACSEVLRFADGSIEHALSEAVEILFSVKIGPEQWSVKALPPHLRLRVRAVDESGREVAVGRDVTELLQRLEPRIRKARAAKESASIERHGITTWDFGDLPADQDPASNSPVLIDRESSVSLTMLPSARDAALLTHRGIRRLFTLACREEVSYSIDALPQWNAMMSQYAQLGSAGELRDHITSIVAERVYMDGQPAVRTRQAFEDRLASAGGRLSMVTREVGDVIARILEPRARVAHRLSGGTPRIWAESVADIREHAAYLMPLRFLSVVPWERLRHYPRYAAAMHTRLFSLREEGSRSNLDALSKLAPHWKRFTAWVAAAMAAERKAREEEAGSGVRVPGSRVGIPEPGSRNPNESGSGARVPGSRAGTPNPGTRNPKAKTPLPQSKRAAPTVNVDAGEWAMQPGRLPPAIERYRWALEELRIALFTPELAGTGGAGGAGVMTAAEVERLWAGTGGKS